MLGEVTCWNTWRSRLEHGDSKRSFSQFFGHPATTGARTNHQNVVSFSPRKEHEPVSLASRPFGANLRLIAHGRPKSSPVNQMSSSSLWFSDRSLVVQTRK